MGVVDIGIPKERLPGPAPAGRTCESCGAILSRNNRQSLCAPCNGGDWDPPAELQHPVQIARIGMERDLEDLAA